MKSMRFLVVFGALAGTVLAQAPGPRASSVQQRTAADLHVKNVLLQPNDMVQGSPVFVTVEFEQPAVRVTGTFVKKSLSFFKTDDARVWYALAGNDVETQPGTYTLAVSAVLAGGRVGRATRQVEIGSGNFTTGTANVAEDYVQPNAAEQRQIAADARVKARAYLHLLAQPQWSGSFVKPVKAESTPSFGETRVLNEEKTSEHRGTDFPANEGSLVAASNSGTVVLAQELYYEGNCVIIDHGQHLFTIYMHLDKMTVKPGDKVKKGERIGLSGKTGRVTGPHLHMGVRWNGAWLDPVKLIGLTLPATGAAEPRRAVR